MYPRQFIDSFWSPDIRDDAFIAMSLDGKFQAVYENVIQPACSTDNGLNPVRVDLEKGGDSIVTRILDGLSHSRLIVAEISTHRKGDPKSRNGNVMWEVGIAHAFRQFEEVILLRCDGDLLLFDIGQIRVHDYPLHNLGAARTLLASLIEDRLLSIDLKKSLLVERAVRTLDPNALSALLTQVPMTSEVFDVHLPLLPQQMMAKLCDLGIIGFAHDAITSEIVAEAKQKKSVAPLQKYRVTPFGKAVLEKVCQLTGGGQR